MKKGVENSDGINTYFYMKSSILCFQANNALQRENTGTSTV